MKLVVANNSTQARHLAEANRWTDWTFVSTAAQITNNVNSINVTIYLTDGFQQNPQWLSIRTAILKNTAAKDLTAMTGYVNTNVVAPQPEGSTTVTPIVPANVTTTTPGSKQMIVTKQYI